MSQRKVGNRVNGMRNKSRGIYRLRALNSPMRASARPDTTSHLGSSFMMPAGTEKNKMMRAQPLVRVRRAKQPDAAAIALLIRQSFREHEPAYTPEAFDLATPRKHEIEKRINKWAVWVAIHRNEIVGTISAHSEGSALQIRSMAVHPSMRGNCTLTRTWSAAFCTLPSRILATPSCLAISRKSLGALLYFWVEVRETTFKSAILDSRARISSCIPSAE